MNSKQFISSYSLHFIDGVKAIFTSKWLWPIGWIVAPVFRVLFPKMAYEHVGRIQMRPIIVCLVYALAVVLCLGLQGILAWQAGVLGAFDLTFASSVQADGTSRVMFLDDWTNLFNYLVLVPLYFVAGTGFLVSVYALQRRMSKIDDVNGFSVDDGVKPLWHGAAAVLFTAVALVLFQAQYAMDVQKSDKLFWFHGDSLGSAMNYNGYAYLIVNFLLNLFVIIVALSHLELFRWSRILCEGIKRYDAAVDPDANLFMNDGHRLKELFHPFTQTAVWSKAFAMLLAINIYTWKASGISGGDAASSLDTGSSVFLQGVTFLFIIIAFWLVSLPRYRVQWQIFQLREKKGVHEYYDIRMPRTMGWSAFIDLLLVTIFSSLIFNSSNIFTLLQNIAEAAD